MYQLIGNKVYDSQEIAQDIENKSEQIIKVQDVTSSTNREDTLAYIIHIFAKDFLLSIKNDQDIDNAMEKAENYIKNLTDSVKVDYSIRRVYAYKYNESTSVVQVAVLIMHIDKGRKMIDKLFDKIMRYHF